MGKRVHIGKLVTGVPGFDELLGGGVPELSFNVIAGTPGSGKTTLAHQIMFSLANPQRRALFFTVLGEPPLKMLRYQQQFSYFDFDKVETSIRFVNLAADMVDGNFDRVMARIIDEVQEYSPSLVFVDSFRSVVQAASADEQGVSDLQHFIQQLGMQMTSWQATTFLIGEYLQPDTESGPIFTVADGILWLSQLVRGDSMVRKIQVVKMRGAAQKLGSHTFRIDENGLQVFPRAVTQAQAAAPGMPFSERISIGVAELDTMMGGGLPAGYSLLVAGPSGSGKTNLATEFLAEGARCGEFGVIAEFEKSPNQLLSYKLNELTGSGMVSVLHTRSLDLSIDEILHELVTSIDRTGARRVVIDSLSGFELALSATFRDDYREAIYRLVAILTAKGVTVLVTSELEDRYDVLRFSSNGDAFMADAIINQRYVEIDGQLRRVLSVIKVRGSDHSKDIRFYHIADGRTIVGERIAGFNGILCGKPVRTRRPLRVKKPLKIGR